MFITKARIRVAKCCEFCKKDMPKGSCSYNFQKTYAGMNFRIYFCSVRCARQWKETHTKLFYTSSVINILFSQ